MKTMQRYNIAAEIDRGPLEPIPARIKIDEAKNGEWVRYEDALKLRDFNEPWIVCAANKNRKTGRIVIGARHFDPIMRQQIEDLMPWYAKLHPKLRTKWWHRSGWSGSDQGFMDQRRQFHSRRAAARIAAKNGQVARRTGAAHTLFSEDLY